MENGNENEKEKEKEKEKRALVLSRHCGYPFL